MRRFSVYTLHQVLIFININKGVGRICSAHVGDKKCIFSFSRTEVRNDLHLRKSMTRRECDIKRMLRNLNRT
jgi:hypothetical protein